jgi:hypothetical protein
VNTTDYSFIASMYSIDDKLHVSAIWWPSSGFIQVCEEKTCYFTFLLVLRSQTVLVVGTAYIKPDDGHQMAETCSLSSIEYLDAIKL